MYRTNTCGELRIEHAGQQGDAVRMGSENT